MFSYLRKHISILKKEKQDVSHNISKGNVIKNGVIFTPFALYFWRKIEGREEREE